MYSAKLEMKVIFVDGDIDTYSSLTKAPASKTRLFEIVKKEINIGEGDKEYEMK